MKIPSGPRAVLRQKIRAVFVYECLAVYPLFRRISLDVTAQKLRLLCFVFHDRDLDHLYLFRNLFLSSHSTLTQKQEFYNGV